MKQENRLQAFAVYSQHGDYCDIYLPQAYDGAFPGQQQLREALEALASEADLPDPNIKILHFSAALKSRIAAILRKYRATPDIMDNRPLQPSEMDIFGSLLMRIPDDSIIILKQSERPEDHSRFISYASSVIHLFAYRLNMQSEAEQQPNPQQSKSHGGGAYPQAPQSKSALQQKPKPRPAPKPKHFPNKAPPN